MALQKKLQLLRVLLLKQMVLWVPNTRKAMKQAQAKSHRQTVQAVKGGRTAAQAASYLTPPFPHKLHKQEVEVEMHQKSPEQLHKLHKQEVKKGSAH